MKEEKIRLLFVCLGNICRSPSAEAVMKKLVKDAGLEARIEIDSAGSSGIMRETGQIQGCGRMRLAGDIR